MRLSRFLSEWGRLLIKGDSALETASRWLALLAFGGLAVYLRDEKVQLFVGSPTKAWLDYQMPLGLLLFAIAFVFYATFGGGLAWIRSEVALTFISDRSRHPNEAALIHEWRRGGSHTLLRVGLRNDGSKTVSGIVVKIVEIAPRLDADLIPGTLRLMNTEPSVREFTLRAKETRYIDVFQYSQIAEKTRLTLCHPIDDVEQSVPIQDYRVVLAAFSDAATKPFEAMFEFRVEQGAPVLRPYRQLGFSVGNALSVSFFVLCLVGGHVVVAAPIRC